MTSIRGQYLEWIEIVPYSYVGLRLRVTSNYGIRTQTRYRTIASRWVVKGSQRVCIMKPLFVGVSLYSIAWCKRSLTLTWTTVIVITELMLHECVCCLSYGLNQGHSWKYVSTSVYRTPIFNESPYSGRELLEELPPSWWDIGNWILSLRIRI